MFRSISRVRALFAIAGILCFALSTQAAGRPPVEVVKENRIDARIDNLRLDKVLRLMSEKKLFEIMGSVPSGEEITLYFSGLTLREAMGKLLRSYNYVLMDRPSREPLLILMGKIERRIYTEKTAPEELVAAAPPQPGAETGAAPQTQPPRIGHRGGNGAAATAQAQEGQQGAAIPKAEQAPLDGVASTAQKAAQAQAQQPETAKQPAGEGQQATAVPKAGQASEISKEGSPPQQAGQAPQPVATGTTTDNTLVWTAEGRF